MPIRPELRHLYRGPEYEAQRRRILERAGVRCEQCGAPNHRILLRVAGWWFDRSCGVWHGPGGQVLIATVRFWKGCRTRRVKIVLTMAHLDHDPSNQGDDNVKMLCQWCHLNYDKLHHAETRKKRKDAARPLLANSGTTAA